MFTCKTRVILQLSVVYLRQCLSLYVVLGPSQVLFDLGDPQHHYKIHYTEPMIVGNLHIKLASTYLCVHRKIVREI